MKKHNKKNIKKITCGEKSGVKLLLWDKKQVEKLQKIAEQIHENNGTKIKK